MFCEWVVVGLCLWRAVRVTRVGEDREVLGFFREAVRVSRFGEDSDDFETDFGLG